MMKIFKYLLIVLLFTSCVISERNSSVEIIYAPKLDVNFENDENFDLYKNGRLLLYSPEGVLCFDTMINDGGLSGQINLVHGINAGVYTLVTICNLAKTELTGIDLKKSKIGQLRVRNEVIGGDKLFMLNSQYELKRGSPQVSQTQNKPMYYNMTIRLTHLSELTEVPNSPYLELLGVPNVFDYKSSAVSDNKNNVRLPSLDKLPNGDYEVSYVVVKFNDNDGVKIRVNELLKDVIETVVISPSEFVDVDATSPQNFVVEMKYKAHSFELIINDWIVGEYNFADFGG